MDILSKTPSWSKIPQVSYQQQKGFPILCLNLSLAKHGQIRQSFKQTEQQGILRTAGGMAGVEVLQINKTIT